MSDNTSFVLANVAMGFGEYDSSDELLHPATNGPLKDYAVTETQYFGFSVPEERIHGLGYFWHHPNLGTISGGISAWQGMKTHHLAAELYDQRMFMSDKIVALGIDHYKSDVGYQVDVLEPFKRMRVQYRDDSRGNAVDVTYTALAPPAMLANRKHFEQPMKTQGSITLRGRSYAINGFNVRDRSWGEVRSEAPVRMPPIVWLTGVFSEDFSFNCLLMDDPDRSPEWAGLYDIKHEQALRGGWIRVGDRYTRVVKASKVTKRDPDTLHPLVHELEVVDESGQSFEIRGKVVSSCASGYWPNVHIPVGLVRWECNSQTGWGDSQECQWTDFVQGMKSRPSSR